MGDSSAEDDRQLLLQRIDELIRERGRLYDEIRRLQSLLTASELKVRLLIEGVADEQEQPKW